MKKKILDNALEHLSQELKMKRLIEEFGTPDFNGVNDYFHALSKSIIYQQLSGKAARTIYNRFLGLFDNNLPQPKDVIKIDIPTLRSIGISQQKSNYQDFLAMQALGPQELLVRPSLHHLKRPRLFFQCLS